MTKAKGFCVKERGVWRLARSVAVVPLIAAKKKRAERQCASPVLAVLTSAGVRARRAVRRPQITRSRNQAEPRSITVTTTITMIITAAV